MLAETIFLELLSREKSNLQGSNDPCNRKMSLKSFLFLALMCLFQCSHTRDALGEGRSGSLASLRGKVESFRTEYRSVPRPSFGESDLYGEVHSLTSYTEIAEAMRRDWLLALENYEDLAPDQISRTALLYALEDLDPESYFEAISRVLDIYANSDLPLDEFGTLVLRTTTPKRWFLSFNYEDERVRNYLRRVKSSFPTDPYIPRYVDKILSGRIKKRDELLRAESSYLASQPVPILKADSAATPTFQPIIRSEVELALSTPSSVAPEGDFPPIGHPLTYLIGGLLLVCLILFALIIQRKK